MKISPRTIKWVLKPIVFALLAVPAAWLAWKLPDAIAFVSFDLTANPIEYSNRYLGDWALRILFLSLAVSPLCDWTGNRVFMHFRRMIGLYAFFYVSLHVSSYVVLDHYFNWTEIWEDVVKRNFITLGFISLLGLTPLALTSTNKMVKRLGGQRWKKLHRLVYPVSILAMIHYAMMVRGNQLEPKIYMAVLAILLGWRLWKWVQRRA